MKIFITGGNGFLGKRLVRQLLDAGHDVHCLVRPDSDTPAFRSEIAAPGNADRFHVVHGSLQQIDRAVTHVGTCDVVIHAAAAMNGGAPVLFTHNVIATRQLLAAFPRLGATRFVLVSSLGVYGSGSLKAGSVMDETCPLDPQPHLRDPYSYSKLAEEQVAWEAREKGQLPLVVIRPGVIYGPGRGCLSGRIGLQVGRVMVKMDGAQQLPYTYVDNCAAAITLAATAPGVEGHAFNIIDDDPPKARQVLRQYRKSVDRIHVIPIPRFAIGPLSGIVEWYHRHSNGQLPAVLTRYKSSNYWKRLKYSNAKARKLLGWTPKVSFADGLRLSCEQARKDLEAKRAKKKAPSNTTDVKGSTVPSAAAAAATN